jgi:hypothetical protein
MPRLDVDLSGFTQARTELDRLVLRQRNAEARIAAAKTALDAAVRAGASADNAQALRERVASAQAVRNGLVADRRGLQSRLDELANGFVRDRDPSTLVGALDGHVPIALMPMRIETRYFRAPGQPVRLRIRVYPDDLNTIDHEPSPTANEQQAAAAYWRARFAHKDDEAARILRDLTTNFGRGRALWLVRVLTPTNPVPAADAQDEPVFAPTDTIDALAKATRAVLLPERWCAIGYASGRREVFRVWGTTIPDELVLSPDWLATDDPEALLGGDRAWMVDFDAALAKGMAIEVTQERIAAPPLNVPFGAPFDLATGTLERLVVVGFEWTKSAADSAADFTDLLAAHRDSSGLGFVAPGTPTNNTEAAPAGYSPSSQKLPPPSTPGVSPEDQDALQLLQWAFGIAPDALPADNLENPHLTDQRTGLHMMNALWRGTFGDYVMQMWNPMMNGEDALGTAGLYALRRYAVSYVRPMGPLPLLRVDEQPYGLLPLVGKRFADPGDSAVESAIGKVLNVLRPMWELASSNVPLLTDGDIDKAQKILQTGAWSQTAYYRDKDAKAICMMPTLFSNVQASGRTPVVQNVISALGPYNYWQVHIGVCNDFLPDPPYKPGYLAGVPWVLVDAKDPTKEASDDTNFGPSNNYLAAIATAAIQTPAAGKATLDAAQAGPALLQALAAYSVQMEQGDAVDRFVDSSVAVDKIVSRATTSMPYVEAVSENEAIFTVQTPRELAAVSIPAITGRATLGEHVANTLSAQLQPEGKSVAWRAGDGLFSAVDHVFMQTRNLGAVKLSLDFLSTRSVGELNIALRSTLDAFSYRLDAWITARANRRLEQMRAANPTGLYIGGYAWVQNLKADDRPDSEGFLLAPSQAQAAAAAILRSGFMANHEQGAFDIALDSKRTRRASDILQGLTRDQPLAALYGYRIERALRDAQLGKFIWPLRLAYPWRPVGSPPSGDATEAVGARDVVDGVALLADWETAPGTVFAKLAASLAGLDPPALAASPGEQQTMTGIVADAMDLADSVSDLLLAEGTYQIVQGNPARAAAAMAVADKQTLPIENQIGRTPRGGASYTQRIVVVCPGPVDGWPDDRRARAEPALNAWIATMLGDPARYRFVARVHRRDAGGHDVIDALPIVATWDDLGLSPLSAVLLADGVAAARLASAGETGFRSSVATALIAKVADAASVTLLDIEPHGADVDDADALGLAQFEAIAMTLRNLIGKARHATRKDVVRVDDKLEAALPPMGEYPGVDVAEIVGRADGLVAEFDAARAALLASVDADSLLAALAAFTDVLPQHAWPAQVFAIDASGADPATRDARAAEAIAALTPILDALRDDVHADAPLLDGQVGPTDAQRAQHAMARLKRLFGKDFPVLPKFAIGPYATEFNASLAEQDALCAADPWRINGWLCQAARVREGADRFAAAVSAHEALSAPLALSDLKVVQFPHRSGQAWAALPEAWREDDGTPFDPKQVPEELRDYLVAKPVPPYRDINRVVPDLAIALHAPGVAAIAGDAAIAAFVCDEWPEFIPDPFQTAGIGFHYDAPGARPPQSILLALPPQLGQDAWSFDDAVDVIHEAFDLARLRGVCPQDLGGGLGALLPGNYLPHSYTDDLPSVRMLELASRVRTEFITAFGSAATFTLGKI